MSSKHIFFDGMLTFKKVRGKNFYKLTMNIYSYSSDGTEKETGKNTFNYDGSDLHRLQLKAHQDFNDFCDKHKFTQGVAMSSIMVKRQKYRGYTVDSMYSTVNTIQVKKG